MKTLLKKVYYCDYCKKRGMSAPAMSKHEKHCTANPDRECRMCENETNYSQIIEEFKTRYKIINSEMFDNYNIEQVEWIGKEVTIDEVHEKAGGCPMCMLTIIRLSGFTNPMFHISFDYHEAVKKWWREVDAEIESYY